MNTNVRFNQDKRHGDAMGMLGKSLALTTVVPRDVAVVSAEDRVRVLCRKLSGNIWISKSHAWPCAAMWIR